MSIADRIQHIQQTIQLTAEKSGRNPRDIQLIAVSKGQSIQAILEAYEAGLRDFAESYWQEAQNKIQALAHLDITWHFIGPIQSNKARDIAMHFDWVHSVDRHKIALLLAQHRPAQRPPLKICIQVNLDHEPSKSGVSVAETIALTKQIQSDSRLNLKGLMSIPEPRYNENEAYISFCRLAALLKEVNEQLDSSLDTLSMGMSDDFEAAIRAGATMLRIGQGIFGQRIKK